MVLKTNSRNIFIRKISFKTNFTVCNLTYFDIMTCNLEICYFTGDANNEIRKINTNHANMAIWHIMSHTIQKPAFYK